MDVFEPYDEELYVMPVVFDIPDPDPKPTAVPVPAPEPLINHPKAYLVKPCQINLGRRIDEPKTLSSTSPVPRRCPYPGCTSKLRFSSNSRRQFNRHIKTHEGTKTVQHQAGKYVLVHLLTQYFLRLVN